MFLHTCQHASPCVSLHMSECVTKSWSEQQTVSENTGPVWVTAQGVCTESLSFFFFLFFWSNENLHSRPPEDHLSVPHTPGPVHAQLCSVAGQLGQQLTHVAASPSYVSAFRTQLSNISVSSDLAFAKSELNWRIQLWHRLLEAK